jgi:hypothetical protein
VSRSYERSGLPGWAAARGWTYQEGGGGAWTRFLPVADRQGVEFQLEGEEQDYQLTMARYYYQSTIMDLTDSVVGIGKQYTITSFLCVIVVRLAASHPTVALERRSLLGWYFALPRAKWLYPAGPASPTGVREFDRRYKVYGPARDGKPPVTPHVIGAYLASDLPAWQVSGEHLVIRMPALTRARASDLDRKVDQALTIARLLDSPATWP